MIPAKRILLHHQALCEHDTMNAALADSGEPNAQWLAVQQHVVGGKNAPSRSGPNFISTSSMAST